MTLNEFRARQEKGFEAPILKHQNKNTGAVYVLVDRTEPELHIEVKRYQFDDKNGNWTVGLLYAGKDFVFAMDSFQGCLNGDIADPLEGLRFTCPQCGKHRLENVMDGIYTSEVLSINAQGDFEYGEIVGEGGVDRWQCLDCGYVLQDVCGSFKDDIIDNEDVVEWIKENSNDSK